MKSSWNNERISKSRSSCPFGPFSSEPPCNPWLNVWKWEILHGWQQVLFKLLSASFSWFAKPFLSYFRSGRRCGISLMLLSPYLSSWETVHWSWTFSRSCDFSLRLYSTQVQTRVLQPGPQQPSGMHAMLLLLSFHCVWERRRLQCTHHHVYLRSR